MKDTKCLMETIISRQTKKSENIEIVKFGQFKKMGDNEPQKRHAKVYLLRVFVVS